MEPPGPVETSTSVPLVCGLLSSHEIIGVVKSLSLALGFLSLNVATTCWLVNDQQNLYTPPVTLKLAVHVELDGPQGCIKESAEGREVQVVFNFAQSGGTNFYSYVAKQFNR